MRLKLIFVGQCVTVERKYDYYAHDNDHVHLHMHRIPVLAINNNQLVLHIDGALHVPTYFIPCHIPRKTTLPLAPTG